MPRVAGRLDSIQVKLGDRVTKGQQVAKVEDRELREQVNQSEANIEVNKRDGRLARERHEGRAERARPREHELSSAG